MITFPCLIENISTRSDRTIKIVLGTPELTADKVSALFAMAHQESFVAINADVFRPKEMEAIAEIRVDYDGGKSPSKRLRGVLFLNWQKEPEGFADFENYYVNKFEKIINHYKSKLQ